MNTLVTEQLRWQQRLAHLYPERETANLLRFALEDSLGCSFAEQRLRRNEALPETWNEPLERILQRLETGEPLQYITGFTWFDELKIKVSPAVLIPRPETEELVDWVANTLPANFNGTLIDWCTGSGCIALALKNRFPQAFINGYDCSDEALQMARSNAQELKLFVHFEKKDALGTDNGAKADVIVSNPPYIPEGEAQLIRANVKAFEPHIALFVPDNDALLFYRSITERARLDLLPGGYLWFELHEDFARQTKTMIEATGAFSRVELKQDLQGKWRMLRAQKAV